MLLLSRHTSLWHVTFTHQITICGLANKRHAIHASFIFEDLLSIQSPITPNVLPSSVISNHRVKLPRKKIPCHYIVYQAVNNHLPVSIYRKKRRFFPACFPQTRQGHIRIKTVFLLLHEYIIRLILYYNLVLSLGRSVLKFFFK